MRVVAGSLRGRRINAPDTISTRPTTDKVREAMFNALGSMGRIEDARVVDLFAGSGAVGIEALSRGAAHCTFVERDKRALAALRANLDHLGLAGVSTVVEADATTYLSGSVSRQGGPAPGEVDLIIADPPYGFDQWAALLAGARAALAAGRDEERGVAGLVVIESDRNPGPVKGWDVVRGKKYGRTYLGFLRPSAEDPDDEGQGARNSHGTVGDR